MSALSKAIEIAGSQRLIAEACGVIQPTVAGWLRRSHVPAEYCAAIEAAVKGAVTRRDLRPDDWASIWPELAANDATQPTPNPQPAALQPLILDASARARLLDQGYVVDHPSAFGSAQHAPGWVGGLPGLPEKAE